MRWAGIGMLLVVANISCGGDSPASPKPTDGSWSMSAWAPDGAVLDAHGVSPDVAAPLPMVSPESLIPEYVAGTRLEVRWLTAPGGARTPEGFYDPVLDSSCSFVPGADGIWRCGPRQVGLIQEFGDPECKTPAVPLEDRADCATGALLSTFISCPIRQFLLFKRGARLPVKQLYTARSGTCTASRTVDDGWGAYAITPAPLSMLVTGKAVVKPVSERLGAVLIEAEDGARVRIGWYDLAGNRECAMGPGPDGSTRCLPLTQAQDLGGTFWDDKCSQPAAPVQDLRCAPVEYVRRRLLDRCSSRSSIHRAGEKVEFVYSRGSDSQCTSTRTTALAPYHKVGAELSLAELVKVEPSIGLLSGTARIAARALLNGGMPIGPSGLHDTALGADCSPGWTNDGKLRCLPPWTASISKPNYFADGGCQERLAAAAYGENCSATLAREQTGTGCAASATFYRVLGVYADPPFLRDNSGACVRMISPPPWTTFYRVGAQLPPEHLVELSRSREARR